MTSARENQKLARLDELSRIYARALDALVDGDFDTAETAVLDAEPILERLQALEQELREAGVPCSGTAGTKTAEVKALHQKLCDVLQGKMGALDAERGRMRVAQRVVRGYRTSAPRPRAGGILDGTC